MSHTEGSIQTNIDKVSMLLKGLLRSATTPHANWQWMKRWWGSGVVTVHAEQINQMGDQVLHSRGQ